MGVWVSVGSRDEPAELSGVSHFLEHLLFKGTEAARRPTSRAVDRVGGDINAFVEGVRGLLLPDAAPPRCDGCRTARRCADAFVARR